MGRRQNGIPFPLFHNLTLSCCHPARKKRPPLATPAKYPTYEPKGSKHEKNAKFNKFKKLHPQT